MMKTMTETALTNIEIAAQTEIARLNELVAAQQAIIAAVTAERLTRLNALKRCYTPEEFAAQGFVLECDWRDYSERSEYRKRLAAGLPHSAPKFKIGDWAYNPIAKENARVVRVEWASPIALGGGWRYSVPGYSSYDLCGAFDGAPNVEYVTDNGYSYHKVEPVIAAQAEQLLAGEGPVSDAFIAALGR